MSYTDIIYEERDQIATIAINRPDVMNSFRGQTVEEMGVLTSSGKGLDDRKTLQQDSIECLKEAEYGRSVVLKVHSLFGLCLCMLAYSLSADDRLGSTLKQSPCKANRKIDYGDHNLGIPERVHARHLQKNSPSTST